MIALLLLSLLHLSTAAVLRQPSARMMGIEETLDELLYEMPEYDDPQMLEYELSQLGSHPIMSLIHMAKKHVNNKHKHVMSEDVIRNLKLGLDSIITRLQTIQARLEHDSTDVPAEDIEKAAQDFKKLEHIIRPDMDQLISAMHQGLFRPEPLPHGGLLNVRSRHPPVVEVSTSESVAYEIHLFTTEIPDHEKKPSLIKPLHHEVEMPVTKPPTHQVEMHVTEPPAHQVEPPAHQVEPPATKQRFHEVQPPVTKPRAHEVHPHVTKPPVYDLKPPATEGPVEALPPPSTEAPKDTIQEDKRAPYKGDFFKSESIQERYEMNPYQSRWTWKTADFGQ